DLAPRRRGAPRTRPQVRRRPRSGGSTPTGRVGSERGAPTRRPRKRCAERARRKRGEERAGGDCAGREVGAASRRNAGPRWADWDTERLFHRQGGDVMNEQRKWPASERAEDVPRET